MVSREQEFWCDNAWGLRWKTWKLGHGIIWRFIPSSVSQALRVSEAVAGAISWIPLVAPTCGVSLITKWWLGWSCYRHGSLQLLQPPSTATCGDGPPLPSVTAGRGVGEEIHCCFKAWALPKLPLLPVGGCDERSGVLRDAALGLSLSSPAGKVRFSKALGRRQRPAAHHTLCPEDHCQADWTRTLPC